MGLLPPVRAHWSTATLRQARAEETSTGPQFLGANWPGESSHDVGNQRQDPAGAVVEQRGLQCGCAVKHGGQREIGVGVVGEGAEVGLHGVAQRDCLRRFDEVRQYPRHRLRRVDDPPGEVPWPKLTLVVSLEAIFLSTFVMIGQNRAAAFQQAKANHDFVEQEQDLKTNTALTREIEVLTKEIHQRVLGDLTTNPATGDRR
jgi:hypothetical protein